MKEEWRSIPGYPNYLISNYGQVKTSKSITPGTKTYQGYRHISLTNGLGRKTHKIHRLVLLTFIGPSELQVNHINGIKDDNRLENLEYVTRSQNMKHSYDIGLHHGMKYENHPVAKLNWEAVKDIRSSNLSAPVLGRKYGVNEATIRCVRKNRSWVKTFGGESNG